MGTERKRSHLEAESHYHITKIFSETNKTEAKIKNSVYLGLLILDISKVVIYGYWYDYTKPKYGDKAKLYYTGMDSVIVHLNLKKILKGFVALRPNMYSCLKDNGHVEKRAKCTKKCAVKREIKFEDHKTCLENNNKYSRMRHIIYLQRKLTRLP